MWEQRGSGLRPGGTCTTMRVYMHMIACVYACEHACMHISVHLFIACLHVYTVHCIIAPVHTDACVSICISGHTCVHMHLCACVHLFMCVPMYPCVCMCPVCSHECPCVPMCGCVCSPLVLSTFRALAFLFLRLPQSFCPAPPSAFLLPVPGQGQFPCDCPFDRLLTQA